MVKSFDLSKFAVWDAYLAVKANKGDAGIDGQTMEDFETDLKCNLYKIWNRLSSGSYCPPQVRRFDIPKFNGKLKPLVIPTISDRTAQMVIKKRLEPLVKPLFHDDSYGYRPKKSALDHKLEIIAVSIFTQCKWTILYIEFWLKTAVVLSGGERLKWTQDTPQGSVMTPLTMLQNKKWL